MRRTANRFWISPLMAFLVCTAAALFTTEARAQGPEDDGPGRGVARVSLIQGEANVKRGDSGDLVAASINAPLVSGDHLLTTPGSRAEVQFDYSNFARLASDSELRLADLENRRFLLQIGRGLILFRILREMTADVEISTPSVAVRPRRPGSYRVEVLDDGTTEITVRDGEAELYTPRGTERLGEGRTVLVRGTTNDAEFQFTRERPTDDFDRWSRNRDQVLRRSESQRYLSRDIYGYEDLDGNGSWVTVAPYGVVWVPRVGAGWAPYRYGRWGWVDYYGWTWISADPWGWAPYHYGRWFHSPGFGWCWWPGGIGVRTWWRPALVAWVGFGGPRVGIGFGRVGWLPLGPYDTFHPWYGRGWYGNRNRTFIDNRTIIVNNTNIYNNYRNARIENAVTAVNGDAFVRGRNVEGNSVRVGREELQQASLVRGAVPAAPTRESLSFSERQISAPNSGRRTREDFYATRQASVRERVPFEEQQQGMERYSREVVGGSGRAVTSAPAVDRAETGSGRGAYTERSRSDGEQWRRFGEPGSGTSVSAGTSGSGRGSDRQGTAIDSATSTRGNTGSDRSSGGWRRFGEPASDRSAAWSRDTSSERGSSTWRREGQSGSDRGGSDRVGSDRGSDRVGDRGSPSWRDRGSDRGASTGSSDVRSSDGSGRGGWTLPRDRGNSPNDWGSGASDRRSGSDRGSSGSWGSNPRSVDRGGDSIRMSPPVVRDSVDSGSGRSSRGSGPSWSGGGSSRDSGGSRSSGVSSGSGRSSGGGSGSYGGSGGGSGRSSGGGGGGGGRSSGGSGRGQ
jgi:hypothetical protein